MALISNNTLTQGSLFKILSCILGTIVINIKLCFLRGTFPMDRSYPAIRGWTGMDTRWVFTLFGTAVGAGILYLPITIAVAGIWALIFMSLVILPMTYLSHRALCRFVLAADRMDGDITEAVEDHFGKGAGFAITLIYFMTLYSICLVYSIGITNEFNAFY